MKTLNYEYNDMNCKVILEIGSYQNNGRLYLGLINRYSGDYFLDITVNLTYESLDKHMAFIDDFAKSCGVIQFIEENQLGKVMSGQGHSGYNNYTIVKFDIEKLREFNKEGVDQYLQDLKKRECRDKKNKSKGMER